MNYWELTPQFWTVIWVFIALVVLSLVVFYVFRKKDPKKPPSNGVQIAAETAIDSFEKMSHTLTGGRLQKAYPYFFTLFMILIFSAAFSLFGYASATQSIMMTFSLGLITFIGIYVIGITTKGIWGFVKHKYINPLELLSQFGPLLSISIRIFGSAFAFAIILDLIPIILDSMGLTNVAATWPLFGAFYKWIFISIDLSFAFLQAYVFIVLTMMYWTGEMPAHERTKKAKAAARAEKRKLKSQQKKELTLEELLSRNFTEKEKKKGRLQES